MNIINIIYIVAAILFVVRIANKNKQKAAETEKENQKKRTFESIRPEAVAQNQKTSTVYVNQNKKEKQRNNTLKVNSKQENKPMFTPLASEDLKEQPRAGESMTDYLSRKAHEEEVERKKEEWEVRREEQKNVGNLRLAKQLIFGDTPPKGSIGKKFPYCGAENLIPQMSREKFHCYFCRSSLK